MFFDPTRPVDRLLRRARLATLAGNGPGLGLVEAGAVAIQGDRIAFAGPDADLPDTMRQAADVVDCAGRWITPGFIDCHTHLVHAGNRSGEFEQRLQGRTYAEIAAAGGGIVSSVAAQRAASEAQLLAETLPRLDALLAEGVTTVEVKSGYGLDAPSERKALRVARRLADERRVTVRTTFLGAHALPPGARGDKAAFIATVIDMLPGLAAEGLVDAVDGFCETIAFSPAEIAAVFEAARRLGLPVKLHADQLSDGGGAALAARFGALSADHVEYTNEAGVAAMAAAGTVAVLLPGAFYFIRETRKPPVDLFRRHGVRIALATDCNPGTSPLTSLLLTMNMGATLFGLTVDECLAGVTREAARALGCLADAGTLEAGKYADIAIWDVERPADLVYRMGFNPLHARLWRGR